MVPWSPVTGELSVIFSSIGVIGLVGDIKWHYFVQSQPPSTIAAQLWRDQSVSKRETGVPSPLVHCLPSTRDNKASNAIARAFCELDELDDNEQGAPKIPLAVAKMRYTSVIASIKAYLATLGDYGGDTGDDGSSTAPPKEEIPAHLVPTSDEFQSALKVLRYLQLPHFHRDPTPDDKDSSVEHIERVIARVQSELNFGDHTRAAGRRRWRRVGGHRQCYICRFFITSPHPLYPSLCHPCGDFNLSSSVISLPQNLRLQGKTVVVTGGRVNLGFHIALSLLRCGAFVIVTTRYPQDARTKYLEERDNVEWKDRLKIVGADFRAVRDVFDLVAEVKGTLKTWGSEKLDILINNAAQTLTGSLEKEQASIHRERILLENAGATNDNSILVAETQYQPRIRGGQSIPYITDQRVEGLVESIPHVEGSEPPTNSPEVTSTFKSSWVQDISGTPYEDVISAHGVNTFAPFILLRELLPLLKGVPTSRPPSPHGSVRPRAYVINVSCRKGVPQRNRNSAAKDGHHFRTNMSKAALNMLTETEAAKTWKKDKVAINAVDPGCLSADPMCAWLVGRNGQVYPMDWEDGAARVLWPVAKGKAEGVAIWGKFLRHFTQVDVSRWN
ncbi:NAD(P)-binding protein [Macrolepiota fuliginosa MF-IS2]|uniref:NAD(P)-binding protein n=1 Tax=Macrolepiota fuliginosa MF-IS2 TaxID=1400762 RepID=A0A9P6BYL3_9AGAR|nr:NAD(P)-binding protein [Macrolepiota fuliginosa MF-IS2]